MRGPWGLLQFQDAHVTVGTYRGKAGKVAHELDEELRGGSSMILGWEVGHSTPKRACPCTPRMPLHATRAQRRALAR